MNYILLHISKCYRLWSISTRRNEIFIFSGLCSGDKQSAVSPLYTQCLHNSAENKKRSVLTLGSLCPAVCGIQRKAYFIRVEKCHFFLLDITIKYYIF